MCYAFGTPWVCIVFLFHVFLLSGFCCTHILSQVFGMSSREENYSVYQRRNNTPEQLAEMLTFNVTGFQQCIGDSSYSFALRGGA